jgi:hypothetical protein
MRVFATFSKASKSALNSTFFDTQFAFLKNFFLLHILALFANSEGKHGQNGQKTKKLFFINVS